ncbi:polysaccharide deacetylase family protein [Nitratifractor sp.]
MGRFKVTAKTGAESPLRNRYLSIFLWILYIPSFVFGQGILTNYRPLTPIQCTDHGKTALLRSFDLDGRPMRLVVDTATLHTRIEPRTKTAPRPCDRNSRYFRLLEQGAAAPWPLQNDGLTHGDRGLYLTTDLCPSSKKGYEERLYRALFERLPRPVPVTLLVTKRWMDAHPAAMMQLQSWQKENRLNITWGNHTAYHHYHPGRPLKENFVLSPEERLVSDVLELEKALIERGLTPSVFFRFPGLVSDRKAVKTVKDLGLIVIGTDAWLAKGQQPKEGSIIFVHGNGNEPGGVDRFLELLERGKIRVLDPLESLNNSDL